MYSFCCQKESSKLFAKVPIVIWSQRVDEISVCEFFCGELTSNAQISIFSHWFPLKTVVNGTTEDLSWDSTISQPLVHPPSAMLGINGYAGRRALSLRVVGWSTRHAGISCDMIFLFIQSNIQGYLESVYGVFPSSSTPKKHDSIKYVRVTLGLSIKICSQCFKPSLGELSQNYICKSYTEYNLFYRNLYARGMDETTTLVLCCKYLPTVFGEDYLGCKKSRVFQPQFMFQIFIGKSLQENIYNIFFRVSQTIQ